VGADAVEPLGAPFLWPFSDSYYLSPLAIFNPVEHGNVGEGNLSVFNKIFSTENLLAACIEVAIVMPLWLFTFWLSRRGK